MMCLQLKTCIGHESKERENKSKAAVPPVKIRCRGFKVNFFSKLDLHSCTIIPTSGHYELGSVTALARELGDVLALADAI